MNNKSVDKKLEEILGEFIHLGYDRGLVRDTVAFTDEEMHQATQDINQWHIERVKEMVGEEKMVEVLLKSSKEHDKSHPKELNCITFGMFFDMGEAIRSSILNKLEPKKKQAGGGR